MLGSVVQVTSEAGPSHVRPGTLRSTERKRVRTLRLFEEVISDAGRRFRTGHLRGGEGRNVGSYGIRPRGDGEVSEVSDDTGGKERILGFAGKNLVRSENCIVVRLIFVVRM